MPMGVGQLLQTVFSWSLANVRFMMNKSRLKSLIEVNVVIRFSFYKLSIKKLTKFLNYNLKRLSSSLSICCTQNKLFKGGLVVVSLISSLFEAKFIKLWGPNFRRSAVKSVLSSERSPFHNMRVMLNERT